MKKLLFLFLLLTTISVKSQTLSKDGNIIISPSKFANLHKKAIKYDSLSWIYLRQEILVNHYKG